MTYVRYLVTDVQKAVDFYSSHLGFTVKQQFPAMAILTRGDLTLWLSRPQASASQPMPDGPGDEGVIPITTFGLCSSVAGGSSSTKTARPVSDMHIICPLTFPLEKE